jgi:hypothetical protein
MSDIYFAPRAVSSHKVFPSRCNYYFSLGCSGFRFSCCSPVSIGSHCLSSTLVVSRSDFPFPVLSAQQEHQASCSFSRARNFLFVSCVPRERPSAFPFGAVPDRFSCHSRSCFGLGAGQISLSFTCSRRIQRPGSLRFQQSELSLRAV